MSGRTQALLEEAARALREGRSVLLVAANHRHALELRSRLRDLGVRSQASSSNYSPAADPIVLATADEALRGDRLRGLRPDIVLVDHHAEDRARSLLARRAVDDLVAALELALPYHRRPDPRTSP